MSRPDDLISLCEADIRAGRPGMAARRISRLKLSAVPRPLRLPLANICRRTGSYSTGMKLLLPVVRSDGRDLGVPATARETAEYAVLLQRNGSVMEALRTLEATDARQAPEALLYRSWCLFNVWEYEKAALVLRDYLRSPLDPYAKLVGRVNLAAALLSSESFPEADVFLSEILAEAETRGYTRLAANAWEMKAQIQIHDHDLARAKESLNSARVAFGQSRQYDQLYVRKWSAYLASVEKNDPSPLLAFKQEALERRDWESLRETDRLLLEIEFDPGRYAHLLFGTPFPVYREKILRRFQRPLEGEEFRWGEASAPCFDLDSCTLGENVVLDAGGAVHRALVTLSRDLYRPAQIGTLFDSLFPGEHFNVVSSPVRVHQILWRTRGWMRNARLPLEIHEDGGFFSLRFNGPLCLALSQDRRPVDRKSALLKELDSIFAGGTEFSPKQAREKMAMSRATFQRLTSWGIENGRLERLGNGSTVLYRLKKAA